MSYIVLNPLPIKHEEQKKQIQACLGCLETKGKQYGLRETNLHQAFTELTGLEVYSGQLCYICAHLLQRFREFRFRCLVSNQKLQEIDSVNDDLSSIDRTKLQHSLVETEVLTLDLISSPVSSPSHSIENDYDDTSQYNMEVNRNTDTENDDQSMHSDDNFTWPDNNDDTDSKSLFKTENEEVIKTEEDEKMDENQENRIEEKQVKKVKGEQQKKLTRKQEMKSKVMKMKGKQGMERNEKEKNIKKRLSNKIARQDMSKYLLDHDYEDPKKKKKQSHELMNEEIMNMFQKFRRQVRENGGDFYKMFERIYHESVLTIDLSQEDLENEELADDSDDDETPSKKQIWKFLALHKQTVKEYILNIEFLSVEKQYQDLEEKRRSGKYEVGYCRLCCMKFNHKETLQRHFSLKHSQTKPFECKICLYRFKSEYLLLRHILTRHNRRATCKQCGVYLGDMFGHNFLEHKNIHEGLTFKCDFCDKNFKYSKLRWMHLRQCHRDKIDVAKCLLCGDTYNGAHGLTNHLHRMHREAAKCVKCKKFFANTEALTTHLAGCVPGCSSCSICGANFDTQELMMDHYNMKCYWTTEVLAKNVGVCTKLENKEKYGLRTRTYRKKIKREGQVKRERVPKSERPKKKEKMTVICEYCGKGKYTCPAQLKIHQRVHTGEKPYKCQFCGQCFRTAATMRKHVDIHTGERRYKCELCQKAFRQWHHVKVHMTVHTKEKRFFCDLCTKGFLHQYNMIEHKRTIHEGLPPRRKPRIRNSNN